jgi:prolipoprotein diacylglyceryl transferase
MQNTASIPSPPISTIDIGVFSIHIYALCIILGVIVGGYLGATRYKAMHGKSDDILDLVLIVLPAGIIGARLYHVLFTTPEIYFGSTGNFWSIFYIWEGGLGIFGGITLGFIAAFIFCRAKNINFALLLDSLAPGILVAQGIGRLGNWFNQELFGMPTDLPWGLEISPRIVSMTLCPGDVPCLQGTLFHPTFLYELIYNLLGAVALIYINNRFTLKLGQTFALYVAIYSFGRFWIEQLRIDFAHTYFGLRVHAIIALLAFLVALLSFVYIKYFQTVDRFHISLSDYRKSLKHAVSIGSRVNEVVNAPEVMVDGTNPSSDADNDDTGIILPYKQTKNENPKERVTKIDRRKK